MEKTRQQNGIHVVFVEGHTRVYQLKANGTGAVGISFCQFSAQA
jgi:hypothetical protein